MGGYRIHRFTASGTLNVAIGGNVEVLVVAGGGGGGGYGGGGGGGGGVVYNTSFPLSAGNAFVVVGSGGSGGPNILGAGNGSNGGNSSFSSLSAIGGGRGGGGHSNGAAGGSGGGGGMSNSSTPMPGGAGVAGQGMAGGNSAPATNSAAGGGGGAGATGGNGTTLTGANGGAGVVRSITGAAVTYGGGGGGAHIGGITGGMGGAGGGGNGSNPGLPGTANTGGGGGGGGANSTPGPGGNGGSGVVIVRYPLASLLTGVSAVHGPGGSHLAVSGQIDPRGEITTVTVQYGTSVALGSTQSAGTFTGTGAQTFNTTLYPAGLTPGTTYYYRAVAVNANGTITGAIQTMVYAAGAPDLTFSGDGLQLTAFPGAAEARGVALQPDGKTVAAGYATTAGGNHDVALTRYLPDGALDATFGSGGQVTTTVGAGSDFGTAVALQSDGKILVAGHAANASGNADCLLLRYHGDAATGTPGTLDASFGSGGVVITAFGASNDYAYGVAAQTDGKLLITGGATIGGSDDLILARYEANGALDSTFDGDGKVSLAFGVGTDEGRAVKVQADGKIVVAGYASSTVSLDFALARFLPNGSLDGTFGSAGKVLTDFFGIADDAANGLAIQDDGKIILAGYANAGAGNYNFAVARYTTNGALDATFDGDGKATASIGAYIELGTSVVVQTDGKLVVAGHTQNASGYDMAVLRFNADGSLDGTFDGDGKVVLAPGPASDELNSVALAPDGDIVAAGSSANGSGVPQFAVVRLLGLPDPLSVHFASASTIGYTALYPVLTGATLGPVTLGFAPAPGTTLMLVQNTGAGFITGQFSSLAQGQTVPLAYNGVTYNFVANYYGGTGNDLVLQWAGMGPVVWGGQNFDVRSHTPPFKAIAAGNSHTVALQTDGTVVAWGDNSFGQTTVPEGLSGVSAIAAGYFHTVALKSDGTVVAWGDNSYGQTTVPAGLSGVSAIAAGYFHTVALKTDGTVVAWGNNGYDQTAVPGGLNGVSAIAAGGWHTVALKTDGTVVAWGRNNYGQTTVPAGLSGVIAIAAGSYHTVALQTDGTVVVWGSNSYDQTTVPGGLSGVSTIAAGGYHTVALVPLPPAVAFVSLSGITASGATVNGTINPNWQATTAQVQYGTTGSYGSTAAIPLSPADGSATQSFSLPLNGLVPGTLYHCRISATSVSGTTVTADGTFTTLGYADIAVFAGPDDTAPELTDGQTEAVDFGSTGAGGAGVTRVLTLKNTGDVPLLLDDEFNAPEGWLADDYTDAPLAPGASRSLTLRFLPASVGPHAGTITLVSNDPDAEESFTFPVTGAGVDVTAPQVTNAEMMSDNSFNGGYASFWDTVSLSFTTNEPVQMPLVTLLGDNVVVTGGPTEWMATQIVGSTPPEGPVAFMITVTDLAGNAAAPVTEALLDDLEVDNVIVDRTPPVVTPPADMLVQETPGTGGAVVNFAATATDENGVLEISCLPAPGTFFVSGVHPVQVTALDNAGNVANVVNAFTVTVNAAPVAVADATHGGPVAAGAFPIFVLANDTDAFGGALDITAVTQGVFGTVAATEGGVEHLFYTPGPGYTGSDTFTYTISDGMGGTATGTVTLTNTAPAAYDGTQAISEDTAPRIALSYADADGDLMTWALVTPPAHGTAVLEEGHYTYTPPLNYSGPDSFTFQVTDDRGMVSNVASITLDVTPLNDAPVVVDQLAATDEDTAVQIPLNGTDVENNTLAYMVQRQPEHGMVSITGGVATYTPAANYSGTDNFAFSADDGQAMNHNSQPATVFITVEPVTDDQDIALEDSAGTALASGGFLFLGGQDVNAGPRLVTVTIRNTGTDELSGLSLAVTDTFGGVSSVFGLETLPPSSIAAGGSETVQVWFDPGAVVGALGGQSNHSALLTVTSNDPDEGTYLVNLSGTGLQPVLSVSLVSSGPVITGPPWQGIYSRPFGRLAQGTSASETVRVTNNGPGLLMGEFQFGGSMPFYLSGPLTYALAFGQSQDIVVTYEWTLSGPHYAVLAVTSNDSTSLQNGMVNVSFSGQGNMPPTAADTAGSTIEDQSLPGGMVPLSASDSEGDALSFEFLTLPQHGTLYGFPAPGQTFFPPASPTLTYVPAPNYSGTDSFTYRVWDGYDYSPAATVTITVLPVNDAPVATDRTVGTQEDTPITFSSEVMDPDGDTLTYTAIGGPSLGMMTRSGNEFTYTPGENWNGTDSYTYQVSDGEFTATAVVTINVASVNDAPETSFDVFSVNEDATLTVTTTKRVLRNDSDLHNDAAGEGNDPLTAVLAQAPAHATAFTFNANGTFTYTPKPDFHGLDGFTYRAVDALGAESEPETVLIAVWAVNDAPMAAAQSLTTLEDVPIPVRLRSADPDLLITFDPNAWLGIPPPNNGPAPHDADPIYSIVTAPQHGTLSGDGAQWIYTPNADFHGQDSFTFTASDGMATSNTATVTITVQPDSDGDALPDAWEISELGALTWDGTSDPDGDGQDNTFELIAGNNPADSNSCLCMEPASTTPDGGAFRLNHVRSGVLYRLESSLDLSAWDTLSEVTYDVEGPGAIYDPRAQGALRRFYRVTVERFAGE